MKSISSDFRSALLKSAQDLVMCFIITRRDGTVHRFTTHNSDLSISGNTYKAVDAFTPSSLKQKTDLGVDNARLVTLVSADISEADLRSGFMDGATVEIFGVIWSNISAGTIPFKRAKIGEVSARQADWEAEIQGLAGILDQEIVKQLSLTCRADLGDSLCKVRLEPPDWTATTVMTVVQAEDAGVGSIVSPTTYNGRIFACTTAGTTGGSEPTWNTTIGGTTADGSVVWTTRDALTKQGTVTTWYERDTFEASAMTDSDDVFKYGQLTWLTGSNANISREVREYKSGGYFTLWEPLPFDIAVGNTFKVHKGCAKRIQEDCITVFDNLLNFRGEPFLPGPDQVQQFPDTI